LKARAKTPPAFKTRRDIERYFGGKTIECLLCLQRFRRLKGHLAANHEMNVDEYRSLEVRSFALDPISVERICLLPMRLLRAE
jgi:hypothetical protein